MQQGTTTLDFGAYPGASDASVAVTGQTNIVAGSLVEAWKLPAATADHSADEHIVEALEIFAGNIVDGTGFTIYGINRNKSDGGDSALIYGQWNIAWVWN